MADNKPADDIAPLFEMINAVAPVLGEYTGKRITEELWHRPGMTARDRALVTVATLVARNAQMAYPHYFNKALDSGVTPAEMSELLAHLAFYTCWAYAFGAVAALHPIFAARGVSASELPSINPEPLPLEVALPDEAYRNSFMQVAVTPYSSSLAHFTDDLLYHAVWRRPGLGPRDRCLVSLAALAAQGQTMGLTFYLNRAVMQGITRTDVDEMLGHTAFYAGWGNAIVAVGAVKGFFDNAAHGV